MARTAAYEKMMGLKPGEQLHESPIIQGGGNDAAYRENYRDYIARLERERQAKQQNRAVEDIPVRGRKTVRKLGNGTVVDDVFIARFKQLYNGPMSVKQIRNEIGCAQSFVYKLVRELELPVRQHRGFSKKRAKTARVWQLVTDNKLLDRMDSHIFGRYRSRQQYVEMLIKRDLENNGR